MIKVFVYGTLKPGERNYEYYCAGKVVDEKRAIAFGQLFDLPEGYPAMTSGSQAVQGYLLTFNDPTILLALDELEDYHPNRPSAENLYQRQQIQTYNQDRQPLELAWVYLMSMAKISQYQGIWLADGWWSSTTN